MDTGMMRTGLLQQGLVELGQGEVLGLQDAAGRHVGVVRGSVWLTQHGDQRDRVLHAGESFRIGRDGLTLVVPLGGAARVVLEDGLLAATGSPAREAWRVHTQEFERAARRRRAAAIAAMLSGFARWLKAAWSPIDAALRSALQARRTARELRALSDYLLKDIGLRRDEIDCVARRLAC